jgi:hypothetical protein
VFRRFNKKGEQMKIEHIRKLAYHADDYNFNIQEPIKGLGMYTKYRLYFFDLRLTITYCKPTFKTNDIKHYFIRCGNQILFQGEEVKKEIAEFEKEFNKISQRILQTKRIKINKLIKEKL